MYAAPPDPFLVAADLFDPRPDPYAAKPVEFAGEILGFTAWSKQRQIMEAVRDHPRVAVRSSHGPGKTAIAAQIALWFLAAHANSRVITTAPTWAQVEQLLWREIRASVGRAHNADKGEIFPRPTATKLEIGDQWFAIGLSTNEPERFQGHHADHLLLVVDEASGVDEKIYEAAEGFLTAEGAHILLVGNPTRIGGTFHRAFTTQRAVWHALHISTFDTPNYTGEQVPPAVARSLPRATWAEEKRKQWGEDSPMYQVRVLGNFPSQAADSVVPLHEVENAQARQIDADPKFDRVVIACDVARFGDDETVIGSRVGSQIRILETYVGQRPTGSDPGKGATTETAGRILHHVRQYPAPHVRVVVDDDGVGGGVTDLLRQELAGTGINVRPFRGGEKAIDEDEYPNARSEAWFRMADMIPELDLDSDEQLAADLTSPTYKLDSRGRRVVEPKKDTKKRLGRSPDRGDMALMTLMPAGAAVVTETPAPQTSGQQKTGGDWASSGMNPTDERW